MKKTILLLLFLAGSFLAKSQVVPSSCSAHDSIISKYQTDAQRLALRKFKRQNLPYKDSVFIPKSHSDTVLNALIAVYNATSLPARDTVVNLENIHSFPIPELNSVYVAADSSLSWMQQLKQNNLTTGNPAVDSLITRYHLKIYRYYNMGNSFLHQNVVFQADSNYNTPALASKFLTIPGIVYSGPGITFGDGNNIYDSIYSTHVELIYSFGWGDCQAGCINRRFWKFKVYFNCSVEFAGSYGDVYHVTGLPEKEPEPFSVYPNPFKNTIFINGLSKPIQYTISSLLGQKLLTGRTTNNKLENLEKLKPGMYLLTIKAGKRITTHKIFKEF